MVLIGSEEETMAMGPERSKPLHNFMLPCLKWGSQRYLRCMKVPSDDAGDRRSPAPVTGKKRELESGSAAASGAARGSEKRLRMAVALRPPPVQGVYGGDDGGIDAVREKLMLDLKTETDRMKDAILRKEMAVAEADDEDGDDVAAEEAKVELAPPVVLAAAVEVRPWNLRTRRAACKAPVLVVAGGASGKGMLRIEEKRPNSSPLRTNGGGSGGGVGATVLKSPKLRGSPERKEKVKFSLPLTRKEVEEDFFELVGHRPPRRPKKRPRNVQKQLDTLFPGLCLSEITADSYKVPEEETAKR